MTKYSVGKKKKHKAAFEAIMDELTKTTVLAYFDSKPGHILEGDGSTNGFGAVLLQKGRPVK